MFFPQLYFKKIYGQVSRNNETYNHMEKPLKIRPHFNLEIRTKQKLHKSKEDTEREKGGLRKASAQEHPLENDEFFE